jgi:hypothetical protein
MANLLMTRALLPIAYRMGMRAPSLRLKRQRLFRRYLAFEPKVGIMTIAYLAALGQEMMVCRIFLTITQKNPLRQRPLGEKESRTWGALTM